MFHISQCNLGQTSKIKHTHTETKPAAGIHIFSKAAKNGFYFPILLFIIERKPRSHDVKGFVHAKLDLHLAKQQNQKKKVKISKTTKKETNHPFSPCHLINCHSLFDIYYLHSTFYMGFTWFGRWGNRVPSACKQRGLIPQN